MSVAEEIVPGVWGVVLGSSTRSSCATITSELLAAVRGEYGMSWDGEPRDCGGVNLNVHLRGPDGGHVLRVYAPWTSSERLAAIVRNLDRWRSTLSAPR